MYSLYRCCFSPNSRMFTGKVAKATGFSYFFRWCQPLFTWSLHPSSNLQTCVDLWLGTRTGMTSWDEKQQEAPRRRFPSKRKSWMEKMKITQKVTEQQKAGLKWWNQRGVYESQLCTSARRTQHSGTDVGGGGEGKQKSNKNPSQAMKLKDTNSPVKGIWKNNSRSDRFSAALLWLQHRLTEKDCCSLSRGSQMVMKLFLLIMISPKIIKTSEALGRAKVGGGRKSGSHHAGFI